MHAQTSVKGKKNPKCFSTFCTQDPEPISALWALMDADVSVGNT